MRECWLQWFAHTLPLSPALSPEYVGEGGRRLAYRALAIVVVAACLLLADGSALAQDASHTAAPTAKRPNILFIAIDDLRPQLGCYGAAQMKTPNIDALAKTGVMFTRAYCQQAVCSPSRTSLLTGLRPDSTHVYDLKTHFRNTVPDAVTLPQIFKDNGYFAAGFGKIFHLEDPASWSVPHTPGGAPRYAGAQIHELIRKKSALVPPPANAGKGPPYEIADCADNALCDGWVADRAVEAMRKLERDKPFFLAVGFEKPHLPFVAPRKYWDLYPPQSIQLPPDMKAPQDAPPIALHNFQELRTYEGVPQKNAPIGDDLARTFIRGYDAATSYMDAQVGRILDALDEIGARQNTIIVFWGDHGYQLGEQGIWCKHTNFENSTRVPLIVCVPDGPSKSATCDALVELVDIYPTLCRYADIAPPANLEGRSLTPLIDDPARPWSKAAFSQYPRQGEQIMGYSIRTDAYRYTEWRKGWRNPETATVIARELYDHVKDPRETTDLADKPEQAEVVKSLAKQLKGWKMAM
jgi:arylsulfatase A-like enzyme